MRNIPGNGPDKMSEQDDKVEGIQESHSSDLDEQIQEIIELRSKKHILIKKILRFLHYSRGHDLTGIILLSIGAASLLLSYLWSSSILTFIGLGITLWGVLIMYILPSRHVRGEVLNAISFSMHQCVDKLVTYMGYNGQPILFHPKSLAGLGQGYMFIPHFAAKGAGILNSGIDALNALPYSSGADIPSVYLDPKGIFLAAPSQGLVDLFEKELGVNFATVDLEYIQQALPMLLIEELKIVDDISMQENGDNGDIVIKFRGGPCSDMCKFADKNQGNHLACPLCSAIGLVVSKVRGAPIVIKETKITDDDMISTAYSTVNS